LFASNARPIATLALGLVLVTTLVVGWVAHSIFPGLPWAAAFALGAIISPPDAIAASAVTQRLRVPRRVVVILEGESLLNDASGLVAYRVALGVAAGQHFSVSAAVSPFAIIATEEQLLRNSFGAFVILAVTIAVQLIWVFPAAWIPRLLSAKLRERDPTPPVGPLLLIGWTGMRGVVSLAAAMALPSDFPFRNLILFVVFVVILGTLVVQGLSLPWLVRKLKLSGLGPSTSQQELYARLAMLAASNLNLDQRQSQGVGANEIEYLRSHFRAQADSWLMRLELDDESILESQSPVCHKAFTGVLTAQRHRLHELVRQSIIEETLV